MQVTNSAKRIVAICLSAVLIVQGLVPVPSAMAETVANAAATAGRQEASENAAADQGSRADSDGEQAAPSEEEPAESATDVDAATPDSAASNADSKAAQSTDLAGEAPSDENSDQAAEDAAAANSDPTIHTVSDLVKAFEDNSCGTVTAPADAVTAVNVTGVAGLPILSNADPGLYQSANISLSGMTGTEGLDLCTPVSGYTFQGLGSKAVPFEGSLTLPNDMWLRITRTLFNGVKLHSASSSIKIRWEGAPTYNEPIVAASIDGNDQTLNVQVQLANPFDASVTVEPSTPAASSALLGTASGNLAVSAGYSFTDGATRKGFAVASTTANAGLIANTVAYGKLTIASVRLPDDIVSTPTVTAAANAGGLVGAVCVDDNGSDTTEAAEVEIAAGVDVSAFTVKGANASGGLIGKANGLTLTLPNGEANAGTVKPALNVGDSTGCLYAGGVIGQVLFAGSAVAGSAAVTISGKALNYGGGVKLSVSNEKNEAKAPRAGALFGELNLSNGDVSIDGGTYKSDLVYGRDSSDTTKRGAYGGLVGSVWGQKDGNAGNALRALTVSGDASIEFALSGDTKVRQAGGVVGYEGQGGSSLNTVALVLDGVSVTYKGGGPFFQNVCRLGGAVGVLDTNNVLDVRNLSVSTADDAAIGGDNGESAGIAGSSWRGIIKFSGITDLSGAKFKKNDKTALLVHENFNSLIFATGSGGNEITAESTSTGWKYVRPTNAVQLDDIYDFGQVIRLGGNLDSNFIFLDDGHNWHFSGTNLAKSGGVFQLSSAADFAKLAIAWQTSGYFSCVDGVTAGNVSSIATATINLQGDIDLSGTGITGLTKDRIPGNASELPAASQTFSGRVSGNGKTIKLAVGEAYGWRGDNAINASDTSDGNGMVYRHDSLGLFMALGDGATITGLTIDGSMRFDDKAGVDAGPLAAKSSGTVSVTNSTFKPAINYENTGDGKVARVGGIIGTVAGGSVTFGSGAAVVANITSAKTENGNANVGGAIGLVAANSAAQITASGLSISGNINYADGKDGNIYAGVGGFIGVIREKDSWNGNSAESHVSILKLALDNLTIENRVSTGNKTAGGLLGYSWGKAVVDFGDANNGAANYALTVNESSVSAQNVTQFGGLVYAASGKWTINDYAIDLTGATFSAPNADWFGMLVCSAGRNVTRGNGSYFDWLSGLYLLDAAPWETAYKVNEDKGAVTTKGSANFDEWIADTRGVNWSTKYLVTDVGVDGVVSLHTVDDKLHMEDADQSNSYENRTAFGQDHPTNKYSRYYYNLNRAFEVVQSKNKHTGIQWLETPEEVLLWSAATYAAAGIRDYIVKTSGSDGYPYMTSTARIRGKIDLTGYSYYPVDASNIAVFIRNASITFAYEKVNAKENGNKKNSEQTQHMNMHAGLFRHFAATGSDDKTMNVENTTLSGTIGMNIDDDGKTITSGALICKIANGSDTAGGRAVVNINGLTLKGLRVANADPDYAPLLVADMTTFAGLDVKELSISESDYKNSENKWVTAGTSLFGNLGGSNADMVSATFNRVFVPSLNNGGSIFAHASLLESFAYGDGKTGTASYTFVRRDQADKMVTFGKEIDSAGEYHGSQFWYYDEEGYGDSSNLVDDHRGHIANENDAKFGDYLPYVYKSDDGDPVGSHKSFHEIKVNQRIPSLVTGCGTYGDPYAIVNANQLYAVSNFIRSGNAAAMDGWEITIVKDQETLCQRRADSSNHDNEVTYVYSTSNGWVNKNNSTDKLEGDTMQRYLQSAYYSIEPGDSGEIVLDGDSFQGFGNEANPFRGVIVGNLNKNVTGQSVPTKLVLKKKSSTLMGLIPYSYGSVVKGLTVEYDSSEALQDSNGVAYAGKSSSNNGVPQAFFGGVIGCIVGGDNIIDGVTVSNTGNFSVAGAASSAHLVPIGGYIGVIAGGGVIFRSMSDDVSKWRDGGSSLYDNPYVGRVIDGYAFSEKCVVDNGDSSYKVNLLDSNDTGCVTTTNTYNNYSWGSKNEAAKVTVSDKQGLLVLSAIINSGAAAGAASSGYVMPNVGPFCGSYAYRGRTYNNAALAAKKYKFGNEQYGKVRNSAYSTVGAVASTADENWSLSKYDDLQAPGNQNWQGPLNSTEVQNNKREINSPYLVRTYANWATGYICALGISGVAIEFAKQSGEGIDYDMTDYGSGYLGLSGRYYSNACVSNYPSAERRFITPPIACINGNGASIKVVSNVKEYANDDYKVSGVGALFGNVMYTSQKVDQSIKANDGATVKDLTFDSCNLSIQYIDESGKVLENKNDDTVHIGVGCLAGITSNLNSQVDYGIYKNVHMTGCAVTGVSSAGGLLGNAGYMKMRTNATDRYSRMTQIEWNSWGSLQAPVKLMDSSYIDCTVTAPHNAGGFVGKIRKSNCEVDVTTYNPVASNSVIRATNGWNGEANTAGGIVGLTGGQVVVGGKTSPGKYVTVSNTTVTTDWPEESSSTGVNFTRGLGGIAGYVENNTVSVSHAKVTSDKNASDTDAYYFGCQQQGNQRYRYVGGLVGYGNRYSSYSDCIVSNIRIASRESGGGIMGTLAGGSFVADGVSIDSIQIDGAYSGGVLGQTSSTGSSVTVVNSRVENSLFKKNSCMGWTHPDGNYTYSGGVVGDAKGTIRMCDILIAENAFEDKTHQGLLLGDVADSDLTRFAVAGLAIKLKTGATNSDNPGIMHYRQDSQKAAINKKSYIAFADYKDAPKAVPGNRLYNDDDNADGSMATVKSVSPYVTTNPENKLSVKDASGGDPKYLFGDGAAIDTAATIKEQARFPQPGRYTYTNIGGITDDGQYNNTNSYSAGTAASTYNKNNTVSSEGTGKFPQVADDFPILLISGNDTTTVANYLNLVTNGGFSDAVRLNNDAGGPHVTAKAEMFELQSDGSFVRSADAASLYVVGDGTTSMGFRASTSWDNERHRFTLLTVTFSETGQKYKVQVPIIVKRMLEIDFTASYAYGTKFNPDDYSTLGENSHVLSSSGESMAGYLTWTYNEANGSATEYGWDTHLASGGSMGPLNKSILFSGKTPTLPAGTQLTLVDTADNDKEYYYTVPQSGATSVKLTDFVAAADGKSRYEEPWFSQTMGVTALEDNNGVWVECSKDDNPGAKIGSGDDVKYYRVTNESDTATRYTLKVATVAEGENKGMEISPSENFYLVITVPAGTKAAVNGYTYSSIDTNVNSRVNATLRPRNAEKLLDADSHSNTASTYSIYTNYGQKLSDNVSGAYAEMGTCKNEDGVGYRLPLDVTDTVTFNRNQQYNPNDKLYFQLSSSLGQYGKDGSLTSAGGWPTGVSGTAHFYVKVGDEYYTWDGSGWKSVGSTKTDAGASVPWSSDGGEMKLQLPYDLSGIRSVAASVATAADTEDAAFTVQVKIDSIQMSEMACLSGIAAGQLNQQQVPSAFTRIRFQSSLAVSESTLETSSITANIPGTVGYYREENGDSTIELSASMQSQLGINVNDLALANGTIAAYGTYDLSAMIDADDRIGEATSVRYMLKLQKRTGTDGTYEDESVKGHFSVTESPLGEGTLTPMGAKDAFVFIDQKANNAFATQKSAKMFQFPFTVKVNTDVEDNNFTYANYRLVLSAELLDTSGSVIDTPVNIALNSGYPNSDYITYTLSKINTSGISHS